MENSNNPEKNEELQNKPGVTSPDNEEKKEDTSTIQSRIDKIKIIISQKPTRKHLAVTTCAAVLIAIVSYAALSALKPAPVEPGNEPDIISNYTEPLPEITTVMSKLTGAQVDPNLNTRPITGVMIENSIDARPQAGLIDAGVVFEAVAEGGITRFLALYQESQPDHIGPIRSARPYYVQWAAGFDAAYTHSGGSGEALNLIRNLGLKDMDHGNYDSYFDRVSNRYAPHNVYTSMARLDSLRETRGYTNSDFEEFARIMQKETEDETKDSEVQSTTLTEESAKSIVINVSSVLYNSSYIYDEATNTYKRNMARQAHTDERSGKQISPSVVIALVTSFGAHPDGIHSTYKTIGTGEVFVFQNGIVQKGKWSKQSDKEALKFTLTNGTPLELQPGQTWITAVPSGKVSYTP